MCPGNGTELTKWFGINVTGVTGMPPETTKSTSTQQDNNGAKSSGPVYSYSQHKNTSKDLSTAAEGQSQDDGVDAVKNKTQSTQPTSSNNQTQQATDFIPPFTTP